MDNNTPKKRPSIMEVLNRTPKKEEIITPSTSQADAETPKEIIRERVVVEYRDKPRGCMEGAGCGCGCRSISCGCMFFVLLLIVGIGYLLINKPPFIWSEVVSYMNNGVKAPEYKTQDLANLQQSINSQINTIGEVYLTLTQDQLTTLVRDRATQLKDVTIEVTDTRLRIYWQLENSLPAKPLYGIIDINEKQNGTLEITRIGTGRVALPDFINKSATNGIYSLLNVQANQNTTPLSILNSLFNSPNINVKSVVLEQGIVKITADIKVDLFQQ
jgi:hypothetical protein